MSFSAGITNEALRPGMVRLAQYLGGLEPLPDRVRQVARLCLLDTLGAGIHGSTTPEAADLLQAMSKLSSAEDALVWGTGQLLGTDNAAFANGALSHLRELDDVHFAILHTGAVCVPAALAVAQREAANLGALLRAIVLGVEANVRVALGMDYLSHRKRGWHGTATCGAFGAAAATGSLLGLDETGLANALGIAGSRTGGSWAFSMDNAMSKRLHPGLAARDGVLSAFLAGRRITGPHYALEAPDGGFYRAYSDGWDLDQLDNPSERFAIEDVEYKWFASCKSVHSPLSAAMQIAAANPGRNPEEITGVTVEVNSSALSIASKMYDPDSVISAQLSIPYGIALGLFGHDGLAADYEPSTLWDPKLFALASKVQVVESPEMNYVRKTEKKSGAKLTVEWIGAPPSSATIVSPKGSYTNPLTVADLRGKFENLVSPVLGRERSASLQALILEGPESTPAAELCRLLRRES